MFWLADPNLLDVAAAMRADRVSLCPQISVIRPTDPRSTVPSRR